MSWSIDGVEFDLPCNIERVAEVTATEISGLMLNREYFNDVLATYMKYKITVAIPRGMEQEYEELYEMLTTPQDAHYFTLPYNFETINLTARIVTVSDTYVRLPKGKQTWRRTSFDIIANNPSKLPDGTRYGMTDMPEAVSPEVGSLYEYTEYGWIQRFYEDADEKEY